MDHEASTSHDVLERVLLDESAEPTQLQLSLLEGITNRFSPDCQIGIGGFAVVYKGMVGKGMVAVKKLSNTLCMHENVFQEEVKCMIKAKHKNIVRFLGYCADTQGIMEMYEGDLVMADQRNWLLCFEYICNGSLDKHITDASLGLNWRVRYRIIRGICEGILFLHEKKIVHLDLKPSNILLDGHMVPKICDFGISRCLGEEHTRVITVSRSGTMGYMDPEYIRSGQIAYSSDIYSLGVIVLEILTGAKRYIKEENVIDSWMKRLEVSERDLQLEQIRACFKMGIECMNPDPEKRPDAREIIDRLDEMASADVGESFQEDSLWGAQDTKQKANRHDTTFFGYISNMFRKFNNMDIFNRKSHMDPTRNYSRRTLELLDNKKIFRKDELKPILRSSNLIGKGGFSEVYMGVVDNTHVAVKKWISDTAMANQQFANEVLIQSQVIHKNIVRLIGCCLEMDTPILIYEFTHRKNLHDILHSDQKVPLSLDVRLTVAAESAQGLAYLHSQGRTKILHGNVKPTSILLDDNLMPKVAGFGLSRLIVRDNIHTRLIVGDMIYLDPVFMEKGLLTEKSDVYSFGIVILELISRKKATGYDSHSLVRSFLEVHEKGKKTTDLFDKEIAVTAGDWEILDSLAEIAVECLNHIVDERPMMKDVAERLRILNLSRRS